MSLGAVVNPLASTAATGAGGIGGAATAGQSNRPLTSEAVFRIEVSLSSRRSSAIVMKTTARLYALEGATPAVPGSSPGKDAEWKPVAYGAPCIQLMRENTSPNSPFHIKIVIAEVESGISLFELEVDRSSQYNAMQNNFHTFSVGGKTYAVQFANDREAERMLESILDLFDQKDKAETVSFDKKPTEPIFKKPKSMRKLNKKDISTPCNFKHVSGITLQRTQTCEDELRGTIQRKMRSMSLSSLSRRKMRQQQQAETGKVSTANGPVVTVLGREGESEQNQFRGLDISPMIARKAAAGKDSPKTSGRSNSLLHKFGSLRLSKKKSYSQDRGDTSRPSSTTDGQSMREKNRMSLPSHYRQQPRAGLSGDLFDGEARTPNNQNGPQVKPLSLSSDNLVDPNSAANNIVSSPTRKAATLDRRHTFVGPTSPYRKNSGGGSEGGQFNYTPYSRSVAANSPKHQQFQQSNGAMPPYYHSKSATLGSHSAQHFQQQMRGYGATATGGVGGTVANSNLANSGGRLHMSDMGLHRTGYTGQTSYHTNNNISPHHQQNVAGYGPPLPGGRRSSVNEMHLVLGDGRGQMPQKGNRMSLSGGIPVQLDQSPMTNGPYPYPTTPHSGQPHPQMTTPTTPTASVSMNATVPTSSVMMTTPISGQNGYYPPTATGAQMQGKMNPPPLGVMSFPQQEPYPVQSNSGSVHYGRQRSQGNPPTGLSTVPASGAQVEISTVGGGAPVHAISGRGDPLPHTSVGMLNTPQPVISQSGVRTSPGRRGGGGARGAGGGASVLSKLPMSPHRQASLGSGAGGGRPREVVTSQSSSYHNQQRMPSQQYPGVPYQGDHHLPPHSSAAAPQMMAPPKTKYTNVQLHQQYHQQYLQLQQKQGNRTTPYQTHGSSGTTTTTRPSMQRYEEYAAQYERAQQQELLQQQQQQQEKQPPPPVAKKSPPKHYHHSSSRGEYVAHMNGGVASSHSHSQAVGMGTTSGGQHRRRSQPEIQAQSHPPPQQHHVHYHHQQQYPNNASMMATAPSPGQHKALPPHMHINNTHSNGAHELVPRPNQSPQQTGGGGGGQLNDTSSSSLNTDSLTNIDTADVDESLASVTDELDRFTEEMSRALEQFDSLLQS